MTTLFHGDILGHTESLIKLVAQYNSVLLDKEGKSNAYSRDVNFRRAMELIATKSIDHIGSKEGTKVRDPDLEIIGKWLHYSENSCSGLYTTDRRSKTCISTRITDHLEIQEFGLLTSKPWTQIVYFKYNAAVLTGRLQGEGDSQELQITTRLLFRPKANDGFEVEVFEGAVKRVLPNISSRTQSPCFPRIAKDGEVYRMMLSLVLQAACTPGEVNMNLLGETALKNIHHFFSLAFENAEHKPPNNPNNPNVSRQKWYLCDYCKRWVACHAGILAEYGKRVNESSTVATCGASGYGGMCSVLHHFDSRLQAATNTIRKHVQDQTNVDALLATQVEETNKLRGQLESHRSQAVREDEANLKEENEKLKDEVETLRESIRKLEQNLAATKATNEELQKTNETQAEENNKLQRQLESHRSQAVSEVETNLKEENSKLKDEVQILRSENALIPTLKESNSELEDQVQRLQAEVSLSAGYPQLQQENKRISAELQAKREALETEQRRFRELDLRHQELRQRQTRLEEDPVKRSHADFKQLQDQLATKEQHIRQLNETLNDNAAQFSELEQSIKRRDLMIEGFENGNMGSFSTVFARQEEVIEKLKARVLVDTAHEEDSFDVPLGSDAGDGGSDHGRGAHPVVDPGGVVPVATTEVQETDSQVTLNPQAQLQQTEVQETDSQVTLNPQAPGNHAAANQAVVVVYSGPMYDANGTILCCLKCENRRACDSRGDICHVDTDVKKEQ